MNIYLSVQMNDRVVGLSGVYHLSEPVTTPCQTTTLTRKMLVRTSKAPLLSLRLRAAGGWGVVVVLAESSNIKSTTWYS